MANTDYQDKLSLFHSFSKTPVVSTLGLGNAINKSGHTVSSTEVWSDEIPYFGILSAVSDLESKVTPYAAKNDICKVGSTYYIRNGVEYSVGKTTAELWDTITLTDGLILKNRFDKDVIKYHSGKQLSDLTGDNNANTDSNHYAARLWTSEGLIEQFVGPTDKALNGLASVGYTPTVYNNGTKIVEGTDYSMVTFSGTVLWNAQHNSGTRTIDCFEYIGAKVSESITGINETIKNLSIQAGAGIGVAVDGNEASTGIHNIEFKKSDEITISQSTDGAKTDITIGVDLSTVENAIKANEIKVADGSGLTINKAADGSGTTIGVDTSVLATKSSVDGVANDLAALTTTVGKNKVLAGNGISVSEGESGTTVSADTTVIATKASVDTVAGNVATLTDTVNSNKVTTTTGSGIIIGSATTANGTPLSIDTSVIATKSTVDALTSRVENLGNVKLDVVVLGASDALPTGEDIRVNTIYLKQDSNAADGSYIEYIGYMNGSTKAIEKIGSTKIDLDGYVKTIKVNGTNYSVTDGGTTVDIGNIVQHITKVGGNTGSTSIDALGIEDQQNGTVGLYLRLGNETGVGVVGITHGGTSSVQQYYANYVAISANAFETTKSQIYTSIDNVKATADSAVQTITVGDNLNVNRTGNAVNITVNEVYREDYSQGSNLTNKGVTRLYYGTNASETTDDKYKTIAASVYTVSTLYNDLAVEHQALNREAVKTITADGPLKASKNGNNVNITIDEVARGINSPDFYDTTNVGVVKLYYGHLGSNDLIDGGYHTTGASVYTVASAYADISSKLNTITNNSVTAITPTGAITATKSGNTVTVGVKSASDTQEGVTKLFNLTSETLTGTENGAASTSTVKAVYDRVADAITGLNNGTVKSVSINGTTYTPTNSQGSINLGSGFVKGVKVIDSASSASAIDAYVDDANNIIILPYPAITSGQDVTSDYGVVKTYYGKLSHEDSVGEGDRTLVPTKNSVERGLYDVWTSALLKTDTTYTKGVKVGANTYNATGNVVTLPNLVNQVYTNDVRGLTNGVANSIVAGSVDEYGKVKIAAVAATDKQAGVTTLHTIDFHDISTTSATGAVSVQTIKNLKSSLVTGIAIGDNETEYNEATNCGLRLGPKSSNGAQYLYIATAGYENLGNVKLFDSYFSELNVNRNKVTQGQSMAVSTFTLLTAYDGLAENLKADCNTQLSRKPSYLLAGDGIALDYSLDELNGGYTINAKDATSNQKGVMKLYSTSTNATDGTVTAAVVDTIKGQVEQLMNIAHLQVKVVTSLPEGAAITANTLYLIKETGSIDTYVEYISYKANESDTNFTLERIGTTKTDLNGFASTITVNGQTNTVTNNSVNLGNIVRGISTSSSALTLGGTNESGITIDVKGASASQAGVAKLFTLTPATLGAEGVSSAYAGAASVATVGDFYKEIHQTVETLYLSNSNKISSNYKALSDAIAAVKTTADGAIQTISTQNSDVLTITNVGGDVNLDVEYATSTRGGVVHTYTYTAAQISTVNDDDYRDVPTIKTVQNIYNELDTTKLDKVVINGSYGTVGSAGGVHQGFYIKATNNTSTVDKSYSDGWGLSVVTKDGNIIVHDGFIGERPSKIAESAYGIIAGGAETIEYVLPQGTSQVVNNFAFDSAGNILDSLRPERMFSVDAYMFEGSNISVWCADLPNAQKVNFSGLTSMYEFTGDLSSLNDSYESFADVASLKTFIGDVSNATDTSGMFWNCSSLTSVISDFSSATICRDMFTGCTSLYEISADFSSFIYDFTRDNPFNNTNNGGAINLETFNGSLESVTNGQSLFEGMSKLKSVTTNLKSLKLGYKMCANCVSLTTFIGDTSSMTRGGRMFEGCVSLNTINMNLGSLVDGRNMFDNCSSITSFGGDLQNLQNGYCMFMGCSSLTSFSCGLPSLTEGREMFSGCKLDLASVQNIADTINTPATKGKITIGVDASLQGNADLATAIAAIEAKNWTVTVEYN